MADLCANLPADHVAPLRTPRGRDRPLWMTDDDMTPVRDSAEGKLTSPVRALRLRRTFKPAPRMVSRCRHGPGRLVFFSETRARPHSFLALATNPVHRPAHPPTG